MRELALKSDIGDIVEKVERAVRLDFEDGVRLFASDDLLAIGWAANFVRRRMNGDRTYYIVNRHINYSNLCKNHCRFCAFRKNEGEQGAYTMSLEEVICRADEVRQEIDYTELHIVGSLHPDLPFSYYVEMLSALRRLMPAVHIQAFTAVEIDHLAKIAGLSIRDTLIRLRDAGLGSLPGGGAEVFAPRIRKNLCAEKLSSDGWLDVMRTAHQLGIRSNATMLYGHIETPEERIDHMLRLRDLQDETGGFLAFIPLAFHPQGTDISNFGKRSGIDDLKMIAVSRLMLDNFDHIKVFWIMLGLKLAQVALHFGADDFDGTVVEEKITHSAGAETPQGLSVPEILRLISETGTIPVERDTLYNEVER
ncbi:MAG: aminofutalosine synthase MqnE [Armatimonadetes bacterium]|nr:aminofutalosine synthase MqnE [Armatimonadota bacterium]